MLLLTLGYGLPALEAFSAGAALSSSLYVPTLLLGAGLVARGEIGLIVSQVALQSGVLSNDAFLISTWAIVLSTLLGPIATGIIARRSARIPTEWA